MQTEPVHACGYTEQKHHDGAVPEENRHDHTVDQDGSSPDFFSLKPFREHAFDQPDKPKLIRCQGEDRQMWWCRIADIAARNADHTARPGSQFSHG